MQGNWKDNGQRSLPICPNVELYPVCLHACLHVHKATDFTNLCSVICTKTHALSQQSVFSLCTHTLTHKNCTQISPEPNYCSVTQCYTELACSVGAQLKTRLWVDKNAHKHETDTHRDWAAELKQLSAVQFGRPAGVSNQASNKIKSEEIEARSCHRRHSVWPKHKQTLAAFYRLSELYPLSYISTHTEITDLLNVQFIYTVSRSGQKQLMSPAELTMSFYHTVCFVNYIH